MGYFRRLLYALLGLPAARPAAGSPALAAPGPAVATRHPTTGRPVAPPASGNPARLRERGLPVIGSVAELARAMERDERELWWMADPRGFQGHGAPDGRTGTPHYRLLLRPKRSGGERPVLAPRLHLKAAQRWILRNLLDRIEPHPAVHGFRRGRSIRSHAGSHVGRAVVLQVDLQNFFHQFTFRGVKGLFCGLGYPRPVSSCLAMLCTAGREAIAAAARAAGRDPMGVWPLFGQQRGTVHTCHRMLPQGAPTSPALANLLARTLDRRLAGLARRFGAVYTRYADDCAFSGGPEFRRDLRRFLPLLGTIARQEGFALVPRKTRVARKGGRQQVTGLVVNRELNVPRTEVRRLRAILHACDRHGPAAQNRAQHPDFRAHLLGRIAHVAAANPARGAQLRAVFDRVRW